MVKLTEIAGGLSVKQCLGLCSAVLVGLLIGRGTAPARVETKEVVKVEYVDRVKVETVERKVYVAAVDKHRRTETTKTTTKTGEVVEKTVVEEGESTKIASDNTKNQTVEKTTESKTQTEKLRVVESQPRWLAGATLSIDNNYGGLLGYRVAGPLWVIGTGNLSGQASVGVALSF